MDLLSFSCPTYWYRDGYRDRAWCFCCIIMCWYTALPINRIWSICHSRETDSFWQRYDKIEGLCGNLTNQCWWSKICQDMSLRLPYLLCLYIVAQGSFASHNKHMSCWSWQAFANTSYLSQEQQSRIATDRKRLITEKKLWLKIFELVIAFIHLRDCSQDLAVWLHVWDVSTSTKI